MKQFIGWFVLVFLILSTSLSAQNSFYTVQVGTFLDAKGSDFSGIRQLGMVYAQRLDNNLFRVFLGGYSERSEAENFAQQLRSRGYGSAAVVEVPLQEGRTVTVIQFELLDSKRNIDWSSYLKFENLFAIIHDGHVKLVTGPYPSIEAAKAELDDIKRAGFEDAFIKRVNTAFLQKISSFETGIKQPLIPLDIEANATQEPARAARNQPPPSDAAPRAAVPPSADNSPQAFSSTTARAANTAPGANAYPRTVDAGTANELPEIRSNVKRRSVLELQKALKGENAYDGALDGLYGNMTKNAYQEAMRTNRDLKKYQVLAGVLDHPTNMGAGDQVQTAINNLISDPKANATLSQSNEPIAKAYQAYMLFTTLGPSIEVNNLMNEAIHQSYVNKKLDTQPPFDYTATYSYRDLNQLLLHLHYVHMAPGNKYAAPCWLYQRHPDQVAQAMKTATQKGSPDLKLQSCDPFMNWEETRTMVAIAFDLNGDEKINPQVLRQAATDRARLFLMSDPLTETQRQTVETWNRDIWNGLTGWAGLDPMHQRLIGAFKISYFQTQVRLEDYYMNKGLSAEKAEGLAMATLKTLVGPHLERFI